MMPCVPCQFPLSDVNMPFKAQHVWAGTAEPSKSTLNNCSPGEAPRSETIPTGGKAAEDNGFIYLSRFLGKFRVKN